MWRFAMVVSLCLTPSVAVAVPQDSLPVTVDASPTAHEQLERARELAARNPAEAARLVQEVLDGPGNKLVPWPPVPDRFRPAVAAAEDLLRTQPALRQAWLRVQAPIARRQLEQGDWMTVAFRRLQTPAGVQACLQLAQQAIDGGRLAEADAWLEHVLDHPDVPATQVATVVQVRQRLGKAIQDDMPVATEPILARPDAPDVASPEPLDYEAIWSLDTRSDSVPIDSGRGRVGGGPRPAVRFASQDLVWTDGFDVRALDRFSGSKLWQHQLLRTPSGLRAMPSEPASLAVAGERIMVLPGLAGSDGRTGPSTVVALDRSTGRQAWRTELDRLGDAVTEELFPHGDALVVGDAVVVQARRSSQQMETAAWLIAMDLRDGSPRWSRPFGAAGGLRLSLSRPLSSPAAIGTDVIVGSSLGVVARVGSALGRIRWLRTWPPPLREPTVEFSPWQRPDPVTDGRIVAWLGPDGESLITLDARDGSTRHSVTTGPGTALGTVRTLVMGDPLLLAVGDDVTAISPDAPDQPVWRLSDREPSAPGTILGRVTMGTLANGSAALVVPLESGVRILDPNTGTVVGRWNRPGGGQPALQGGQLVMADEERLELAMPAREGERLLRDRLAQAPADPRRGMALLELGVASKRPDLVLDGARAVRQTLEQPESQASAAVREQVVKRLTASDLIAGLPDSDARMLLAMAGEVARTTPDRLAVVLASAELDARTGQAEEAVLAWWNVWTDPAMRHEPIRIDSSHTVAAGPHALARGSDIGPQVRQELCQKLLAAAGAASDPLERLRNARALMALQGVEASRIWIPTLSRGQPSWIATALSDLGGSEAEPSPRALPMQPAARWLAGSLVPEGREARQERPLDGVLLRSPSELMFRSGPDLAERWRHPLTQLPVVAAWHPMLVLWSAAGSEDGSLTALDPTTGRELARVGSVRDILPPGNATRTELECLRCGPSLIILRKDGAMACLDLDGLGLRWTAEPEESILCGDASAWAVVTVRPGQDDGPPRVTLRDTTSGQIRFQGTVPTAIGEPRWVRANAHGVLIGASLGVAMLELADGLPPRWQRANLPTKPDWKELWAPWLLLKDRQEELLGIDLEIGSLRRDFMALNRGPSPGGPVVDVRPLQEGLLVHRTNRLSLHARDGSILGVEASGREELWELIAPAGGGLVVSRLERLRQGAGVDRSKPVGVGHVALLHTLDPTQGLRLCAAPMRVDTGRGQVEDIDVIEGWVLLSADQRTAAIPTADPGAPAPR